MRFFEALRVVWVNIIQNKFKVLLTSLGIIVGTVTIVLVIGIGKGGEAKIAEQFQGLSAESIYINLDYGKLFSIDPNISTDKIPKLTQEIMEQILAENSFLKNITIQSSYFKEVKFSERKSSLNITAVLPNYEEINHLSLATGNNISDSDVEGSTLVAVIGDKLAREYFKGAEDAIGQIIKIGNQQYTIIGVLNRSGEAIQGVNPDNSVFIPFSTGEKYMADEDSIPFIIALANNINAVQNAMKQMRGSLDYLLEDGSIYALEDTGSRIDAAMASARTMNMLLLSVATIVFIVGGIGIMNVLFVSVKERTKEIGILKALGSSKKDIMGQFLLESIIISLFGGIVGILLSYLCIPPINILNIPLVSSLEGEVAALIFAVATGTLFGFYPAFKASRLRPIEALSYE